MTPAAWDPWPCVVASHTGQVDPCGQENPVEVTSEAVMKGLRFPRTPLGPLA